MLQSYIEALGILLQPTNFIMMYVCCLVGCVLGAIPGLSGGLGITLILPLTFALTKELSFSMLVGMYVGGVSGSFIAAVLVGIPGSAASIGTCYDGYPMTRNGQAAKALSIGITGSFIGTVVSIIVAMLCSGAIADIALKLGPWEYFSLCLMAITMVVGLSNGSIYKGLLSAFIGFFLAMIGADKVTNQLRFTFGNTNLFGGINMICLLMGTFALQQVATAYAKGQQEMPPVDTKSLKGFGLTIKDFTSNLKTIIVSLLIGLFIGFLPGMGSGISNLIAYGQAKKMDKHPEKFGTGYDPGIWATEVSNNAGVGGALIPMISLGIPGDATTVLL
ncbi:MAG: tripartite tricarboxylate transporter permease, partial [Clostridia bacterium]|nr:tripartite tricarboxylate transporter permease [Clostridia bacterium]